MKKISYRPFLLLAGFLFLLLCFPQTAALKMRHVAMSSIGCPWQVVHFLKKGCVQLLMITPPGGKAETSLKTEVDALKLENHTLREKLKNIRAWLLQEERVDEQLKRFQALGEKEEKAFCLGRSQVLRDLIDLQLQALSAKVIYREPASWSSFLWLNVGEKTNRTLNRKIVAKNSPVVVGTALVGVVEEVFSGRCRVRLITDPGLVPSVRAARGKQQNQFLSEYLEGCLLGIQTRKDLFQTEEELKKTLGYLSRLKSALQNPSEDLLLAKGELFGSGAALWRSREPVLRGVGFNYDHADEEGPARDLRTGESLDEKKRTPLLKAGDLLVTTGMDGVFPAGLRVAVVSEIASLREGACSYEIEARSVCGSLEDLSYVTVLPPIQ